MSGLILLPNPSKKRARKKATRRRRKMSAKQLKYFGPRRRKAAGRPSARKARKGKRTRKQKVLLVATNPTGSRSMSKKRKRHSRRRRRTFAKNPIRRRFRRNPIEGTASSFINSSLIPAAIGAVGAVGTDIVLGQIPMPNQMRTGTGLIIFRILASLGVGWAVGAMTDDRKGAEAAAGGIIVTLYQIIRPWSARNLPFRMARYVPMRGMGRGRWRLRGVPPGQTAPGALRYQSMGLKGMGARPGIRRLRKLKGFVSPARGGGRGMTPSMMRYIANN